MNNKPPGMNYETLKYLSPRIKRLLFSKQPMSIRSDIIKEFQGIAYNPGLIRYNIKSIKVEHRFIVLNLFINKNVGDLKRILSVIYKQDENFGLNKIDEEKDISCKTGLSSQMLDDYLITLLVVYIYLLERNIKMLVCGLKLARKGKFYQLTEFCHELLIKHLRKENKNEEMREQIQMMKNDKLDIYNEYNK
ncbi:hypothetical protein TCON_2438 [Astathelohania contejeani]|uniref:Uncharacterized protein n=1 Tax=Astathelohania contejeani TaxID=164912 RepID=A0ABQ7HW46_9MICR|nr:hypothetical protein TCON_2438 [Thelohania contejeani]